MENTKSIIYSVDFVDLCQAYRMANIADQTTVVNRFNAIIDFVNEHFVEKSEVEFSARDKFAAKAMQALIDSSDLNQLVNEEEHLLAKDFSKASYNVADAMLTQRESESL